MWSKGLHMARTIPFLYQRRGKSKSLYYRYTYPADVRAMLHRRYNQVSLNTTDPAKARIDVARLVSDDLLMVSVLRAAKKGAERHIQQWKQKPGTTIDNDDGSWSYADENEIIHWTADRKLIKREANGQSGMVEVKLPPLRIPKVLTDALPPNSHEPKTIPLDRRVLNLWIKVNGVKPAIQREAERAHAMFVKILPGKSFATANKADGRALSEHMFGEEEMKTHTVRKMVGHLRAAVNVAVDNPDQFPTIKLNPFSGVVTRVCHRLIQSKAAASERTPMKLAAVFS